MGITEKDILKTVLKVPQLEEQLEHIVQIIQVSDGDNITTILKNAVLKKGHIKLYSITPITVIVNDTILIGDSTTIELMNTVTIKKADNTNKPIFKNADTTIGNKNIKLIGGTYDFNRLGNTNYDGHGILFNNVENVSYKDIMFKNERKYCSLVCNCKNYTAENIRFDTNSDGLHFQPPLKNATFKNISGKTNDDMIAFTLGDYAQYEVTNVGDMENITIDGVFPESAKCCVKVTGSGLNKNNVFRNISISNIYGNVTEEIVAVINDTLGGNDHLTNTVVYGLKISNIDVVGGINGGYLLSHTGDCVQCTNITINDKYGAFLLSGNLKTLQLNNISNRSGSSNFGVIYITGSVDEVQCSNININSTYSNYKFIEVSTTGTLNNMRINNLNYINDVKATWMYFIRLLNPSLTTNIYINNLDLKYVGEVFRVAGTANIYYTNTFSYGCVTLNYVLATGTIRLIGATSQLKAGDSTITSGGKVSINDRGHIINNVVSSKLNNPQKYDQILHTGYDANCPEGVVMWNGTAWVSVG